MRNYNTRIAVILLVIYLSMSCKDDTNNEPVLDQKVEEKTLDWSNPVIGPFGISVVNHIRVYYLVGDFDEVSKYIVNSKCMNKNDFENLMTNADWGYEVKFQNIKYRNNKFIMSFKTIKEATTGLDQYIGTIINDTAKIYIDEYFTSNPFVYRGDNFEIENTCY